MGNKRGVRRAYGRIAILCLAICLILNILAFIPGFGDAYRDHVYPHLIDALGAVTNAIPINIGELVMYLAIIWVVVTVIGLIALIFLRRRPRYRRAMARNGRALLMVALVVGLLYTLTYTMPLHATPLRQQLGADAPHTLQELQDLRNLAVDGLNQAAAELPRDDAGDIVYPADPDALVADAMRAMGEDYPALAGAYPAMKPAYCSAILEWMGIGGFTYPFAAEETNNRFITPMYRGVLFAHESAHHRGFYMEADAEFLACVALAQADDPTLRFAAYQEMYGFVERVYESQLLTTMSVDEALALFAEQPQLSAQVRTDMARIAELRQEVYEAEVSEETAERYEGAAREISTLGWDTQSALLQENNYGGVVGLLLAWNAG